MEQQHQHLFAYGQNTTITGKVDSFFKKNNFGFRGEIELHQVENYQFPIGMRPKVLLYAPNYLNVGDIVQVTVTLKPIVGLKNEVGFDAEKYYFSQEILAKALVKKNVVTILPSSGISVRRWLHERFVNNLQDLPYKRFALAISFADRTELTNSDWEVLKQSGLAHLVAISGLHIGIAYLIGYLLGSGVGRVVKGSLWLPALIGVMFALFYVWLAGFSITTTRAFTMVVINVGLSLLRVRVSTLYRLLLTLSFVLCLFPFSVFSASFWLSFIAVSLVFVNRQITHSVQSKLWKLIIANILLSLAMMPVSAWFFGGVSVLSGLYNLVFIPLFSVVIVPILFLLLFVTAMSVNLPVSVWLGWDKLLALVPVFSGYANGYWLSLSFADTLMICTLLGSIFLGIFLTYQSFVLLLITCVSVFMLRSTSDNKWTMDVLDVGQGSAILLQQNQHYLLYDTGKSWSDGSIAKSVISLLLVYQGAKKLDGLMISHIDNDHAGGEHHVVENWHPDWILSSRILTTDRQCNAGQKWQWQSLDLLVLWPQKSVDTPRNSDSCVIRVSDHHGNSVLLTGDITKHNEWEIVKQNNELRSNILIVPHHGSGTSSSYDFIKAVQPDYAIASLARDNHWHFPKAEVVKKYQEGGAKWLDTAHTGQLHVTFYSDGYQIQTLRSANKTAWYRQMLRKKVE